MSKVKRIKKIEMFIDDWVYERGDSGYGSTGR